ncbi:hypothetical protein QBC47DRAFT_375652 [Echria macrotheca]|uniref:Uncharacterized protein n=1 Tax=Echria macrotheca TaxID=438768 RepID=A0AAJ0BFG5_9PEZI|nr:hypothetical protein QBC47DRAFT_375652 [Echria macrotheca]
MNFLIFAVSLFSAVGLVAGRALPNANTWQSTVMAYYNAEACHSLLTSCRTGSECCPGLACKAIDGELLCTPSG